jgi:hypothetical protein
LRRRQAARQLQQGERVSACLGDDGFADLLVQRSRNRGGQQPACIVVTDPADDEFGQPTKRFDRFPCHEHDRDRFRQQPPRDERECMG